MRKILFTKISPLKLVLILSILLINLALPTAKGQTIGLDNWYNHESNVNNGIADHYYWTNTGMSGYSEWGKLFTNKGATLTTLQRPDSANLSNIDVYIIVDPDTTSENASPNYILANDITAIKNWVENGGVLVLLGNDAKNCEFTHFNQLSKQFGITFDYVTIHADNTSAVSTNLPDHFIFNGVTKIFLKGISTLSLTEAAESILTESGQTLMAESKYGAGIVFAVGDPWLYNEYISTNNNMTTAKNLTNYLLHDTVMVDDTTTLPDTSTTVSSIHKSITPQIKVYPNPTKDKIIVETNLEQEHFNLIISNNNGEIISSGRYNSLSKKQFDLSNLPSGVYFIKCITNSKIMVRKILKQ